jgi:nuclear polyadenylated RNA-binding protein NAB2
MSVEITEGSPLAQELQRLVQPKLVELGWGSSDDSTLSEYVILMLINSRTQEQIASELSNDLLGLGPDDPDAADFSRWLFEQIANLTATKNSAQSDSAAAAPAQQDSNAMDASGAPSQEMDMGDSSEAKQMYVACDLPSWASRNLTVY